MLAPKVLIRKSLTDIERKLYGGAGASIVSYAGVEAAFNYAGVAAPSWVVALVVIVFYFVGGFLTRSAVPADTTVASQLGADVATGNLSDSEIEKLLANAFQKENDHE